MVTLTAHSAFLHQLPVTHSLRTEPCGSVRTVPPYSEWAGQKKSVQPAHPTSADVLWAVRQLDHDRDGCIWESDLDALLELIYGADLAQLSDTWQAFKASCRNAHGALVFRRVLVAFVYGHFNQELRRVLGFQMQARDCAPIFAPPTEDGGSSEPGRATNGRLGPFSCVQEYLQAFRALDSDRNGVLCAEDLQKAMKSRAGQAVTRNQCRDIIRCVDKDGNRVVCMKEFGALLKHLQQNQGIDLLQTKGEDKAVPR